MPITKAGFVQVLCEIAKGSQELVKAGTQQIDPVAPGESSAAVRRVAYTFRQLAALMEQCADQLAKECPAEAQTGDQTKYGPAKPVKQLQGDESVLEHPQSGKADAESKDQEQGEQQHSSGLENLCRAHTIFQAAAEHIVNMDH